MIQLRDYQIELKNKVYQAWDQGHRNVLLQCPTGGGKSLICSDVILDGARIGMTQSVMAHRNELVTQMSSHIARRGIPHRIIGSKDTISQAVRAHQKEFGKSFVNPSAKTSVIGVDTFISRSEELKGWAEQHDRIVGDEWHHCLLENKWGKAASHFRNARILGVTATPARADGRGLGRSSDGIMDVLIEGPNMRWLIDNNYLCDYEIVCPESDMIVDEDDLSANGDWSSQTLKKASKNSHIVGDVVENYGRYAYGRKAIVFATDVETAGDIAKKFKEHGIPAVALSGKTPTLVREKYINDFKSGAIWVLVNVDLFDEGFDVPDCDVCIMARPTASLAKYLQMVGRVLRYMVGKIALIIDHVSNVLRHKLPDRYRVYSLNRRDKRARSVPDPNDIPLTVCVNCTKPYERFMPSCPSCGYTKPLPEPRSRSIDVVEGDLILLDRETLARMRGQTTPETPASVAQRVTVAAGSIAGKAAYNRQLEKINEHDLLEKSIEQWAGIQRHAGFTDSEIARKFYLTMGVDILSVMNATQTREELEKTRKIIEGWYAK